MRKAVFAGKLYESEFHRLDRQINSCFEQGPGALPVNRREKSFRGAIIPSCNYLVSGSAAAWAYKEIAESRFPELYIIIGSTELGSKAYLSLDDFETPLGIVRNARIYIRNENIIVDESIHGRERGIEIQLPFLQHVSKERQDYLKILPVLIGNCDFESLRSVADAIKSINRRFIVIASCNLNYIGDKLGKAPFKYNVGEEIKNADMMAIEFIRNGDVEGFWKLASKINMKEKEVICVLLEILRGRDGRLLMYDDTKEATGRDSFITYCSVVF